MTTHDTRRTAHMHDKLQAVIQSVPAGYVFEVSHRQHSDEALMPIGVFTDANRLIETINALDPNPIQWAGAQGSFGYIHIVGYYGQPVGSGFNWQLRGVRVDDSTHLEAHISIFAKR